MGRTKRDTQAKFKLEGNHSVTLNLSWRGFNVGVCVCLSAWCSKLNKVVILQRCLSLIDRFISELRDIELGLEKE